MKALLFLSFLFLLSCDSNKSNSINIPEERQEILSRKISEVYQSPEKKRLESTIAQASEQGKKVLLKISAAWCGPCATLDKEISERKDEFAEMTSDFLYLTYEEMFTHQFSGVFDFLPGKEILQVPGLYVFDPKTKKWSFLAETGFDQIKSILEVLDAEGGVSEFRKKEFRSTEGDSPLTALMSSVIEDEREDFLKFYRSLKANDIDVESRIFMFRFELVFQMAISKGFMTVKEVLAEMKKLDAPESLSLQTSLEFTAPVILAYQNLSILEASTKCWELKKAFDEKYEDMEKTKSEADDEMIKSGLLRVEKTYQEAGTELEKANALVNVQFFRSLENSFKYSALREKQLRELVCLNFMARAKMTNDDMIEKTYAEMIELPAESHQYFAEELASFFFLAGHYDKAWEFKQKSDNMEMFLTFSETEIEIYQDAIGKIEKQLTANTDDEDLKTQKSTMEEYLQYSETMLSRMQKAKEVLKKAYENKATEVRY